jgi:hypothetical protein
VEHISGNSNFVLRDVAILNENAVCRGSGAHAALHNITRDVFDGCYFPQRAHIFRGLHEAGAAVAAFGPTVCTLKCYLRDAADVRSVAALPAALPQLCSLTI